MAGALVPRYKTFTIAAGAFYDVNVLGRYITLLSITPDTATLMIDDDGPERIASGTQIDCGGKPYRRLRFGNVGLVAITVVCMLSDVALIDMRGDGALAAIAALLTTIDQEISGGAATAQLADLALPATPGPGLQVFAANAARKEVEVWAPETNAGYVYLGITAARSTAGDKFAVLYPGGVWWSEREKGAIFACGSDALEVVCGREC